MDYSSGNLPKRADGDDGTHCAFIAWSTTKDDKVYAFGDTYTGGSNTVEISENTIVYAVWGVDTDGEETGPRTSGKKPLISQQPQVMAEILSRVGRLR